MVHLATTLITAVVGVASLVSAHPGHNVKAEAAERAAALKSIHARGVSQCSSALQARGLEKSNIARRERTLQQLRQKRGLDARAPLTARDTSPLNETHHSSMDVNLSTDPSVLFASEGSCVLAADVTQGPYYVTGELIRSAIAESQEGVPLYLDVQLIDSTTCKPVPEVYLDFWHCNATGVYSGIIASGNGNSDDASNIDTTFLRGLQKTDSEGVAFFESIFPGHYTSRATHIHVLTHPINETTVNQNNNTISGLYTSHTSHVGQIFFDQDLISAVEATEPYASNTQDLTVNADDSILSQELESDIDPFVEYVYLGKDVSDGILAWVSVVMDASEDSDVTPAAYYTEEGGFENESSSGGGSMGGGSAPSGAMPTPINTKPSSLEAEDPEIQAISASLKKATIQENPNPSYNLVSTNADVAELVELLKKVPADPPSLFIDLEGVDLSRHGTISLLQIFALPQKQTHLVDIHKLKESAFTQASVSGATLKDIPRVPFHQKKSSLMCAMTRTPFIATFGINLAGIQDLQLMELATRRYSKKRIHGLAKCIENDAPMSTEEMQSWKAAKQQGLDIFAPERGGSYEVFNARPLAGEIIQYCIEDVRLLPRLWEKYNQKLTSHWRRKIDVEGQNRVRESQSSTFNGKGRHMTFAPKGWY
ncbi:hypothetical protein ARAM_007239 [Aspergillus rambellii]|uniref:Intradiol ring-cleavage dioxygenases domain-containing protein n=1 Tax=Aspergillus rambellii TaxID=308745 RepID=A0A0F8US78_9EURO|nr:hypothetical protein ARAM_007239 [Aspergillus rambellii]